MGDLNFNIEGNNEIFIKTAEQVRIAIYQIANESEKASDAGSKFGKVMKKAFAAIGGTDALKKFVSDVVRVRSEYQQLELSFKTVLQSKEKADELMSQMMRTAAETPFSLTELSKGAELLVGYGVASEEVNDTLLRLGEIASGVGLPLEQITSLYGNVMSQGSLYTEDLTNFSTSGIPMLQGLADVLGVSTERVNEMVSAGEVGFPEVQKVIENLTNQGGQFYGSMAEQSQTIAGEINNLQDAWEMMLNGIGESQESVISSTVQGITYLIEHYETIGKILLTLIETYGVYKAACIANIVFTQSLATTQLELGLVMGKLKKAFVALTASMNLNPFVLAATAIIGLGLAMWNLSERTTAAEKAQKKFNEEQDKFNKQQEQRKQKTESLIRIIQDETETEYAKINAYEELKQWSPALTEAYSREEIATLDLKEAQRISNEERDKMNYDNIVSQVNILTEALHRLKEEDGKTVGWGEDTMLIDNSKAIEQTEEQLIRYRKLLEKYIRAKKEAEENSKPLEVRIELAKNNLEEIEEEYNKLNTLMIAERAKCENDPWYIIPLRLQLEYESADRAVKEARSKVVSLEKQQTQSTTYRQDLTSARTIWIKAKEKYQKALASPETKTKDLQKLKEDMIAQEQAYKALGGNTQDNTEKIREQQKRLKDLIAKQADELARSVEDQWNKIEQAQIDAMDEGRDKVLAQMEFNHERELEAIDREKEEQLRKKKEQAEAVFNAEENLKFEKNPNYKKGDFDGSSIELSDTEQKQFDEKYKVALARQAKERKAYEAAEIESMNEYLKEYGTLMEKRQAIIDLGESKKKGKDKWEQQAIDKETEKALTDLEIKAAETSSIFAKVFSGAKDRSVKDMKLIIEEAQKALDFIKQGKWDPETGAKYGITSEENFKALGNPQQVKKAEDAIQGMKEQANTCDTALGRMADGFGKLFKAGSDPTKTTEALSQIKGAMDEVMQGAQFLSGCLSQLGDAFGNDTLSGIAEGINVAMDAANAAMSGAQAGNALFGPWGAAAGAAIGLVSSLGSSIAKIHDAKHEKKIKKIQEQIEVLDRSYDNLGDSLDTAFSSDAAQLIDEQNTLLEQQKVLIQNQIAEEKSKKKTDWGRIKEWENQIEDINKLIEQNKEKQLDAIMGEDLKSAIENFAQAYADAWSAGDEKAKSSKDLVKNMIKNMITAAIKAASSKPMEALRQKLAGFFSDGIISAWEREQIEKDAESIMNDLDRQFGWADEYMKGDGDQQSSSDSSGKGFAAMSQETGEELNGRFTAMQITNEEIKNSMSFVVANLSSLSTSVVDGNTTLSDMRNLALSSNSYLQDIAGYTKKMLVDFGGKLESISNNTQRL